MQANYLSRYLKDLQVNKPKIFVETISLSFFAFGDRSKSGFENFPLISNYIKTNYNFEGEIGTARFFLRKDATFPEKKWKRGISIPKDVIREFHSNLELFEKNGTFLKCKGWATLGTNTDYQQVALALTSKSDTLFVDSYQMSNKEIVDFSPNNTGYLMCGFIGYIPLKEIPMGDYEVGLFVENEGKKAFKSLNRIYSSLPNPLIDLLLRHPLSRYDPSIHRNILICSDGIFSVWFPANTVQHVSKYFIDLQEQGRSVYYNFQILVFGPNSIIGFLTS